MSKIFLPLILFAVPFQVAPGENDGAVLLDSLCGSPAEDCSRQEHILSVVSKIYGPWSLVFWQVSFLCLFLRHFRFSSSGVFCQFKGCLHRMKL